MSRIVKAALAAFVIAASAVAIAPAAVAYPSGDPSYCQYAGPGDLYHNIGLGSLPTPYGSLMLKSRGGYQGTSGGANGNVSYDDECSSATTFQVCIVICIGGQYAGQFQSYRIYAPGTNCSIPVEYVEKNFGIFAPLGNHQVPCQNPLYDMDPPGNGG